jgi:hypothetical protein
MGLQVTRRRCLGARHGVVGVLLFSVLVLVVSASADARPMVRVASPDVRIDHGLPCGITSPCVTLSVLTVTVTGDGSGIVASNDGRINCGSTCSSSYDDGTTVVLSATPAAGSTFAGWSGGGCSGTGSCVVLMTAASTVTAEFQALPPAAEITGVTVDPEDHVVVFGFTATGQASEFKCSLMRKGESPRMARCTSPQSYDKLDPGVYEFTVQAVGPDGGKQTPLTRELTVPIEFSDCWGAASRDPEHPCGNRALKDVVVPTPSNALLIPLGFCGGEDKVGPISMCSFGVDPATARGTIALIGDSHAGAFLPAMAYVATHERWQGLAYIHNGCAFSDALMAVGRSYASACHTWSQAVMRWLWQQPEISTLVISGADRRGFTSSAKRGFQKAWQQLPPWIHRIFIIRDVPHEVLGEADCVERALARHRPAGTLCAQPRSTVLTPDSEAAAAVSSSSPRVHLLDFTPFFCDEMRCFPVVGGALVLSDVQHMTREFSLSLGPYLLRSINAIK